jgi:hypothetical protein
VAIHVLKAIDLLDRQIEWTKAQLLAEQSAAQSPLCPEEKKLPLKWTGSIAEWVELIYALYLVKRINGGKISLKSLFRWMGEIFDFEVREHASYFMNIKNRTDEKRTKFTDLMCDALLERMTESDRKPPLK